jgi:hypothetical protein
MDRERMSFQGSKLAPKDLPVEVSSSIIPDVKTEHREEIGGGMERDKT